MKRSPASARLEKSSRSTAWPLTPPRSAIDGAAQLAEAVIAPLNASGDEAGCRLDAGRVTTPPGFAEAYRQYLEAGWPTLGCAVAHGGQGLPALAHTAVVELLCGANQSWTMVPILSHGVYKPRDLLSRKILGDGDGDGGLRLTRIRACLSEQAGVPEMEIFVGAVGRLTTEFECLLQVLAASRKTDREAADFAA